jgi:hypothetical protein
VVDHLNPRDGDLHLRRPELILLPLRQEVIDGVLQLAVMSAIPIGDGLPSSASHNITARCSECWLGVPANHIGPMEDLHNGPVLKPPWMRDPLDPELWGGGDAHMAQQSSQSAGGDRSLIPEGLKTHRCCDAASRSLSHSRECTPSRRHHCRCSHG